MDMQVADSARQITTKSQGELTFSWLYEQVQAYASTTVYPKASRLERGSFWTGFAATGVGLAIGSLPAVIQPALWMVTAFKVCLGIEVAGFVLWFILMLIREGRQYRKPRLSHAIEMDDEFNHWRKLVALLREFPKTERQQRLRYVSQLRTGMIDRTGLMYGGLQKLGPFPLLIALYLQFRNWKWGDWAGAFDVSPVGGLLIFALVLLYVMGWVLIGIRVRLDTYVSLLEASLEETQP
ncbi:hypothetical protein [Stenotrophomonas sp. PS02289]|uniref:hypothetical protein n=1 Tax=Stenotrophomonas sp. PS02289 TaxID=2991422 RepID=UPI002499F554|nr:hypothetical protein [Stenotrophomonas sp. PS02289]